MVMKIGTMLTMMIWIRMTMAIIDDEIAMTAAAAATTTSMYNSDSDYTKGCCFCS